MRPKRSSKKRASRRSSKSSISYPQIVSNRSFAREATGSGLQVIGSPGVLVRFPPAHARGGDADNGNADFNGKPTAVDEPLYPYYPDDNQTSTYGPAPGLVPGGPNAGYGGLYEIPNRDFPAYAYRDWSVGCDWNGSACASASWEITEPSNGYQSAFVLIASFMMSGS